MRNSCNFTGKLVAEPKMFEGQPSRVCFTLSVLRGYKDNSGKAYSDYFDFVAWRDTAEYIARHFHKGDMMRVDNAKAKVRFYEDSENNEHRKVEFEVDGPCTVFRDREED